MITAKDIDKEATRQLDIYIKKLDEMALLANVPPVKTRLEYKGENYEEWKLVMKKEIIKAILDALPGPATLH